MVIALQLVEYGSKLQFQFSIATISFIGLFYNHMIFLVTIPQIIFKDFDYNLSIIYIPEVFSILQGILLHIKIREPL